MNPPDEREINPITEMSRIAQDIMNLNLRGFRETYRSTKSSELIYDSQWCRINLLWEGWEPSDGNTMQIRYGRLHALSEKTKMFWNGEECYCWHRIEYPLHFLDKLSAAEVVKLNYSHRLKDPFYDNEMLRKFQRRQPEWLAEMHVTIWRHYGNALFELFDLRRDDLWQEYRLFLREFYDLKGRRPGSNPPLDKVC